MAAIFNQSSVSGESLGHGGVRQILLSEARVPGTAIRLDRLSLAAGGEIALAVSREGVGWLQVLDGKTTLSTDSERRTLTTSDVAFLPPDFVAHVASDDGAALLYGEIPQATRIDPQTAKTSFRVVDWTREPVLDSEHDARKRIYLVTPKLAGTNAVKGEMIIYPPGTAAANHHHEGAEHFMYVLRGRGTVYANEQPFAVKQGDVIYYPDRERHYLEAAADEELVFAEFFAPAEFKTVWVDESQICTWNPTGRDIKGRVPVRDIKRHSVAQAHPEDV